VRRAHHRTKKRGPARSAFAPRAQIKPEPGSQPTLP